MTDENKNTPEATEGLAPGVAAESTGSRRCYKHYCRKCHAMRFFAVTEQADDRYPRCCGKPMAYLGIVDAIPGPDFSLRVLHANGQAET